MKKKFQITLESLDINYVIEATGNTRLLKI
jgi:hypothetical protein